jgi:serine protease AprX
MKRFIGVFCAVLLAATLGVAPSGTRISESKIGPRLTRVLSHVASTDTVMVWVFFKDKGPESLTRTYTRSVVSERSFARRLKVKDSASAVDSTDWPVNPAYVREIAEIVLVRHPSRWFNAVSVFATKEQIYTLSLLPIVDGIEITSRLVLQAVPDTGPARYEPEKTSEPSPYVLNYGPSLRQVEQLNIPALHDRGNNGQGVLIALMDAGFPRLDHEAFSSMKIIATYDFVEHRTDVTPSDGSGGHGTMTLSTIGGYKPGELIGPAFGATYVLARTEIERTETPVEEDNWIAAIEWADSIGVDITSTSLGYLGYDYPYDDLTWKDMNGNTALITRAADMAVSKGILVVNSAGNTPNYTVGVSGRIERDSLGRIIYLDHNTLGAPADGDSVLTAGAVDAGGGRASFSSVGPTTSNPPRIKPDVMAMGVSVYVAVPGSQRSYGRVDGTSFSCPLTAGLGAIILRDVPTATPMEIIAALHAVGSRAANPDNLYGWGIPDAVAAIEYLKKRKKP